jgi:hypothetical protein
MKLALPCVLIFATIAQAQQPAPAPAQPARGEQPAGQRAGQRAAQPRRGQTPAPDRAPATPEATFPSVYSAAEPAELTADPNSPFWKDIKGVSIEKRIDSGEPAPQLKTDVRSRWTDKNLYFLFVCPYEMINLRPDPQTEKDTSRLWEHDVFELYIGSNFDDITKYHELQVSPQGEHLDGKIDATVPTVGIGDEWVWESGWKTKARLDRDNKVWYGEIQLPIAAIDSRPAKAGNEFRINVYRLQGPHPDPPARRDFVAWLPTGEYHPHRPLKFGRLKLMERQ